MQDSDRLAETAAAANSPYKPLAERLAFERALGFNLLAGLSLAALIAVAGPARALELGDARVTSAIGQKLSVEIPYRVHSSESLPSACVSLVGGGNSQLPAYTQIDGLSTRNGTITIAGSRRVLEPLIGLNIRIACSSAPHIVRSYELFVDPAGAEPPPLPQPQPAATRRTATPPPAPRSVRPRSSAVVAGTPIVPGQAYTVVRGDTLSAIAARIERRDSDLWTAVEQIFAANPSAFDRGSRDLLREGATLEIPLFGATSTPPATTAATPAPAADPADDLALAALAASLAETGTAEPAAPVEAAAPPADDALAEATPATPTLVASDSPFVDSAQSASLPAEIVSAGSSAAPTVTSMPESRTPGWLVALVGALAGTVLLLLWLLAKRTPAARSTRTPASPRKAVSTAAVATGGAATAVAVSTRTENTREEPALDEFNISNQFGAGMSEQPDVEFVTAAPTAQSALDQATPDEEDPLAISSVDLDIGEALIATGIDIGSASPMHASGDTSTLTHLKSAAEDDIDTSITMAEMDILQRDYEAEFTATQQLNADLAAAVADLKRTQDSLAGGVVPSDDTLITGAHDPERTAALDDPAAYLADSDSSEPAGWDARTVEVASQLTDEVMAYPAAALSEPTQEMPVADEEAGDTVEMPPRAGEDQAPWQSSNDEDDSDGDWPAFHEAAKRGGN